MITLATYFRRVAEARAAHPEWRAGQAFYNVLEQYTTLNERVRGNPALDPFYSDANMVAFLEFIAENWTPRVLHKHHDTIGPFDVYVGRPSKWGNPFEIGRNGSRAEVIEKFRAYLANSTLAAQAKRELRGRNLVCWCSPKPCHGDVLLEVANAEEEKA